MFENRKDAGTRLGEALSGYKDEDCTVLGIPRGGAEIGYYVAEALDAEFSLLVCRKLPLPGNPEAGFGAIAEDGSSYIVEEAYASLPESVIEKVRSEQEEEIRRRVRELREERPFPDIENKTVILADDGIAMGSTMCASVRMSRNRGAAHIIAAAPVAGRLSLEKVKKLADETVVLEIPRYFQAVARIYRNWYDVPDREVINIMNRFHEQKAV